MRSRIAAIGCGALLCLSFLTNFSPLAAQEWGTVDLSPAHKTPVARGKLTGTARSEEEAEPLPNVKYFSVETRKLYDDRSIDQVTINGPPTPPVGVERRTVEAGGLAARTGAVTLSEVPAYDWSYGCSATSAAMIAAYYDRTAYPEMYTGPTNRGLMPMDNSVWGHTTSSRCDESPDFSVGECPLSATHSGIDGRTTRGHVDDYWTGYACPGPDPYEANGWSEHDPEDSTGDFMKTSKWFSSQRFNIDGSTTFYFDTTGAQLATSVLRSDPEGAYDGGVGIELFYESRGYTVTTAYNQYIRGQGSDPSLGFTYDDYKAEIDAGRPVMIHLAGHTMVGVGYDDAAGEDMLIHDTWDYSTYAMTWGASYQEMEHLGVTIVQLEEPPVAAPIVTSITPDRGFYTETVHITDLAGSNFQSGATVTLTKSDEPNINATSETVVSSSTITCDLDLTGAATGWWDVVVTNPDSLSGTLPNGFRIKSPGDHDLYLPLVARH